MKPSRLIAVGALCGAIGFLQACASSGAAGSGRPASDADAAIANLNLGAGYVRQGRADVAIEPLERALDLNPRLADAHSTIAIAFDQLGRLDEAEQHYRRATSLEPNNASAANSYAVFLCRQNRFDDAEPFFRRAADNPRYTTPEVALANAGVCARDAGNGTKAQEYFRAALEKNPAFPDALSSMMEISYRDENYLQARAFMQRYLDVRAPSAPVLFMCVNIEQELDNPDGVTRCATQLRDDFPQSPEVAQLQELLERDGRD